MFSTIKLWLASLSGVGKIAVGITTIAVAGTAVAAPVAMSCTDTPVTLESIELEQVRPSDKFVLDGTLLSGDVSTKSAGIPGEKKIKYTVVTKCNKQISKTRVSEEQTKAATDNIVSKGTRRTIAENESIGFNSVTEANGSLDKGVTQLKVSGVNGAKTLIYEVSQNEGEAEVKKLIREEVVKQPITQVTYVGTKVKSNCDPNYSGACVPIASDVDCSGGSGNGPAYVRGPVYVIGYDKYDLDRNGDGVGCE